MIELPPPDLFEGVILGGSGRYMGHDDGYTATTVRRLLEEAHEARRVAHAECERLKEERARIGIEHRRLIAEAVEKEREAHRTRQNMTLASPEIASAMGRLKERIATEPGYALGLLVDAGICNSDGTLTQQFGGGSKDQP